MRPDDDQQQDDGASRRFGGARLRPRTPAPDAQTPEVIDADDPRDVGGLGGEPQAPDAPFGGRGPFGGSRGGPFGGSGGMFGSRSFGGGRFQVVGCSPGCLGLSLIASIILTILLNAIL